MSRQESAKSELANLLAWERSSTSHSDQFGNECVVPGPVNGFVDRVVGYVNALREVGSIDDIQHRAEQFESLTAPGSAMDFARNAIQPIVEAFASAREGIGGVEWTTFRPSRPIDDGFIQRRRRTPHVVSQDVVSVISQLGNSLDCFRWNPSESHRCVRKLLTYSLEPPLPNREGLEQLEKLMDELQRRVNVDAVWGCWLLIQCNEAAKQPPPTFAQLVLTLDDIHIEAIKAAARFTANLERVGTEETPALDPTEYKKLQVIRTEIDPKREYIGESAPIYRMFQRIDELNRLPDEPVLILGATGAGKTKLAELIHQHSSRRDYKFVAEQSADVMNQDEAIVRERWVGYGKGSTLPNTDKAGREGILHECQSGTVFFDELHACPEWFQTFLLGVLDKREIPRAHGKSDPLRPNVRMVFASNLSRDALHAELKHDLMRRLDQWIVEVPPLKDRKDDIVHFAAVWANGMKLEPGALLALIQHDWSGNVGELRDVLKQAQMRAGDGATSLGLEHIELSNPSIVAELKSLNTSEVERQCYRRIASMLANQGFQKGKGLQKRMAEILGVSEPAVSQKSKNYLAEPDPS